MSKSNCWTKSEFSQCQIDFTESLERWAAAHIRMMTDQLIEVKPVWTDASFTLKYYSDALFDFPHWFGQSKRQFKVNVSFFLWLVEDNLYFVLSLSTGIYLTCFSYLSPLKLKLTWARGRWSARSVYLLSTEPASSRNREGDVLLLNRWLAAITGNVNLPGNVGFICRVFSSALDPDSTSVQWLETLIEHWRRKTPEDSFVKLFTTVFFINVPAYIKLLYIRCFSTWCMSG